jgi:pyruvate/2-oxoglutarate dehydrogenase complex dihydrolipoamide acyltransferase (E2) component
MDHSFQGYLMKKGDHGKARGTLRNSWRRRFFTINGNRCVYYEGAHTSDGSGNVPAGVLVGAELKGAINISGCRECPESSRPRSLELLGVPKHLMVQAEDDATLAALKQAVAGCLDPAAASQPAAPASKPAPKSKPAKPKPASKPKPRAAAADARVSLDDFEVGRVLGRGMFATVALVVKKDTGERFALKSLNKKELVARYQVEATKVCCHSLARAIADEWRAPPARRVHTRA